MPTESLTTELPDPAGGSDLSSTGLPLTHNLKLAYLFSLLIGLLTGIASIAGLLSPDVFYPAPELRQSFLANDVVNLLIALPILLGSMWLARRQKLIGLLFWPGALFYGLYNYTIYLFAIPFNAAFMLYLAIVTLSTYTTIGLMATVDGAEVKEQLVGRVPERLAGGVLSGFGVLFILRTIAVMAGALASQNPLAGMELALLLTDFLVSPAWIIGGALLWRRQALGYVSGTGLLFQASMLFVGLIFVLLLQPLFTPAPFVLVDVMVIFVMGLICFVPFALYVRGVVK
jgi:hypothetical protein